MSSNIFLPGPFSEGTGAPWPHLGTVSRLTPFGRLAQSSAVSNGHSQAWKRNYCVDGSRPETRGPPRGVSFLSSGFHMGIGLSSKRWIFSFATWVEVYPDVSVSRVGRHLIPLCKIYLNNNHDGLRTEYIQCFFLFIVRASLIFKRLNNIIESFQRDWIFPRVSPLIKM